MPKPDALTPAERRARARKIVREIGARGTDLAAEITAALANPSRFLLVERNVGASGDPSHWLTTHDTPDDAARYHTGQEYREDWEIDFLVNLDTGERFDGDYRVVWTAA